MALLRSIAAGEEPSASAKTGWSSFTFTVVLVSLLGTGLLALVLLWILGDWEQYRGPLDVAWRIILAAIYVLVIATVLTRVAIFGMQRKKLKRRQAGESEAGGTGGGERG